MARITLTDRLHGVGPKGTTEWPGENLLAVLNAMAADFPLLKAYVVDDHERARKHVAVFIDGVLVRGQTALETPLGPASDVYVMQALSGG